MCFAYSVCLAVVFCTATGGASAAFGNTRVAVAVFVMPDSLRNRVAPQTLTDLLLQAGRDGLTSDALLPDAYLAAVIQRFREELTLSLPKKDLVEAIDPTKIRSEKLLLPTVSKLNDSWEMTATIVDLKTFDNKTVRVSGSGNDDALPDLVERLWREVDRPAQRYVIN